MRLIAFLTSILVAVLVVAGIASGATVFCEEWITCYGTSTADEMYGTNAPDHMLGQGGGDRLFGDGGSDTLRGESGNDRLIGQEGTNHLFGGDGDDYLDGGDNCQPDEFNGGEGGGGPDGDQDVARYVPGIGNSFTGIETKTPLFRDCP